MAKLWVKTMRPSTALEEKTPERVASVAGAHHQEDREDDEEDFEDHAGISRVEAVVGGDDAGGQLGGERRVVEVVVHVGEHAEARCGAGEPFEALRQVGVGGVRLAAQRVENEGVEALEHGPGVVGNLPRRQGDRRSR